jgi:hypothetical protein
VNPFTLALPSLGIHAWVRQHFPLQSLAEQVLSAPIPREKHVAMLASLFLKRAALFDQQSALLGASSSVVQFSVPAITR